jgi:transposase
MTKYDEQFKLKVVREYVRTQTGNKTLAKKFGCKRSSIEHWTNLYRLHGKDGLKITQRQLPF